jgi:hypothetical protein
VWIRPQAALGGSQRFFYLTFRDASLKTYYNNMFTLTHQYKYTLTELENMIPWERDMYIGMVNSWVKEETEKLNKIKAEKEFKLQQAISKVKKRK